MEGYLLVGSNGVHLAALAHTNVGAASTGRDFKGAVGADNRLTAELTRNPPSYCQYFISSIYVLRKVVTVDSVPQFA